MRYEIFKGIGRWGVFSALALGVGLGGGVACGTGIATLPFAASGIQSILLQACPIQPLRLGDHVSLPASASDAQGNPVTPAAFQYDSLNRRIATVDPSGEVTAVYPGQTEIRASAEGVSSAPCVLTVEPPENSQTVRQLSDNNLEDHWGPNNFWKMTARNTVLWQHTNGNGDIEIRRHERNDPIGMNPLITTIQFPGDVDFMALGSGKDPDEILASYRVDLNETWISDDGAAPQNLGPQDQEENSIADGCFWFREGGGVNDLQLFTVLDGLKEIVNLGESHGPVTSGCLAVWELRRGIVSDLIYYDGQNQHTVATDLPNFPSYDFRDRRIVYADGGDIVLVDVSQSPFTTQNITNDGMQRSDRSPRIDGNTILWHQVDGMDEHIWIYEIEMVQMQLISTTLLPKKPASLQIDLKQALWVECDALPCSNHNASLWFHG